MGDGVKPVPVAEFIDALRAELRAAQKQQDPGLQFVVGPVTVEFTVATRRDGGPEGKVRFWLVEAGVSGKIARESMQKMTLSLTPVDEQGRDVKIADSLPGPPP